MSLRRKWKDFLYIKKAIISRDRVKEKNYKIIKEYDHIISIKTNTLSILISSLSLTFPTREIRLILVSVLACHRV